MNIKRDSRTVSPWQISATAPERAKLDENKIFDVIIIGGGITGITTALLLQKQGKQCLLVEGQTLGFGTTGGTTAHINTFFDATYPQIDRDFGKNGSKLVAAAGQAAIETIKSLTSEMQIECQLNNKIGYLFSQDEEQSSELYKILEASKSAGVKVAETDKNGVPIPFKRSLAFAGQYQFHPLNYIFALAKEFISLGGQISEHTFIREVKSEDNNHIANSEDRTFRARHLVYATHLPPGINQFSFRCAPYRSYVLGIQLSEASAYPDSMAYDLEEPYHYIRTHEINGEKLLIVGGADHKTGHDDPENAFRDLEGYAKKYFPIKAITYRWSSQYYVPVDGLPYIGPMSGSDDTTYVATGFNGNGMTWGTVAALIISDAILQKENRFADLFKPYRIKPIAGLTDFVEENLDVVYHFIADRFQSSHLDSLIDLKNDEGLIIDYEGKKLAVYRDNLGKITALNPICTHAGCTVGFNSVEKSWDCPCHGGRFDLNGKVITGPPRKNLAVINLTKESE